MKMNRREKRGRNRRELFSALSPYFLRFIFLFLIFHPVISFGETDTTKSSGRQYDINDPRNPDCPCHKLQRQADEEYAQLKNPMNMNDDNNVNVINKRDDSKNRSDFSANVKEKRVTVASTISHNKNKRRKKVINHFKWRYHFFNDHNGLIKIKPNHSICFKW